MVAYNKLENRVPVVAVPSSYNTVTEDELFASGISISIYANHMLRSAYPRMKQVAEGILRAGTGAYVQNMMTSVKTIINLLPNTGQVQDVPLRRVARATTSSITSPKVNVIEMVTDLHKKGINRFFGVPDSVLKLFCEAVEGLSVSTDMTHVISCNEGTALTTAAGWHLATNDIPVVYLQNSGFGNMINPLMSLCHGDAFGVPVVLLIGWRGEPSVKDEPQHRAQGRQMIPMLESCEIDFFEMPSDTHGAVDSIEKATALAREKKRPVAVLVRQNMFVSTRHSPNQEVAIEQQVSPSHPMTRRAALEAILDVVGDSDFVVSTTGYTSRELYGIQQQRRTQNAARPFGGELYMVGSMGHALSIAHGVALAQPERRVWCIDGDGALLMHMGSMASTATLNTRNIVHVLLNNSCHESVGGQRTAAPRESDTSDGSYFSRLALAAGYSQVYNAGNNDALQKLNFLSKENNQGSTFLEITTRVDLEANKSLPRPKETLTQFKDAACQFLRSSTEQ